MALQENAEYESLKSFWWICSVQKLLIVMISEELTIKIITKSILGKFLRLILCIFNVLAYEFIVSMLKKGFVSSEKAFENWKR